MLLICFFLAVAGYSDAQTWYRVKWVNDGDTIVLNDGRRVRYIGINAPEIDHEYQKAEPFGYKARSFNQQLVNSQKIRLEFDKERHDQYGRWLAYAFLRDKTFINLRLLQEGYAYYLYRRPNGKYHKILLKAQQKAMKTQKGLWQNWQEKREVYIGNRRSKRFHLATCPFASKINWRNRINFSKKWDAFWVGYAPADKCIREFWSYEPKN
jgi:micrococcal nuclease